MGTAMSGSSPLLDDALELTLHGSDVVVSLNSRSLPDAIIHHAGRKLGVTALSSNLDACLLRDGVSQFLDEASR